MKNNYSFKVKLEKETACLTIKWIKSFEFKFIWQDKEYKAEYWWNSDGKEDIEWYNKPDFGEKEDEIMEQLYEYIEKNIDKEYLNFKIINEI